METVNKISLIFSGVNLIILVLLILFVKYTIMEYLNGLYERIKALQKGDKTEKIEKSKPIPFTPEILEKNGFELNEKESEFLSKVSKTKILAYDFPSILGARFFIEYNVEGKVAYLTDHCYLPIRYVDEFQQLLRLMSPKAEQVKQVLDNFVV